jgi:voltage-gated sodium channel
MAVSNGGGYDTGHLYMQIATDEGGDFDMLREEEEGMSKPWCQEFVEMMCFQMVIGAVIAANAIIIGLETDVQENAVLWQQLEDAFLIVFLLELLLKLCVYGLGGFFRSTNPDLGWNVFDFSIVALGVTDSVISHFSPMRHGSGARFFVLLMRTFRLLRLLRIIRLFRLMKQLYLLANSMLEAASAVVWVSVLCILILYICAIVLTRLVGQPRLDDDHGSHITDEFRLESFGTVPTSMLTLFRLMAFPDMEKYKPVYEVMPALEGFLLFFIVFMAFAMVSLLTGVITESLLDKGRRREDERRFELERARRYLAQDLRRVFQDRDSGSGLLNRNQFEKCKDEVLRLCVHHSMRLRPKDLDALFELVDDGSGNIDAEELLYGMVQLNSEVRPMAVMELRRLVVRGIHGISEQMASMDGRMQMMDRRMIELQAAARFGALDRPASADSATTSPVVPVVLAPTSPMAPSLVAPAAVDLLGTGGSPSS